MAEQDRLKAAIRAAQADRTALQAMNGSLSVERSQLLVELDRREVALAELSRERDTYRVAIAESVDEARQLADGLSAMRDELLASERAHQSSLAGQRSAVASLEARLEETVAAVAELRRVSSELAGSAMHSRRVWLRSLDRRAGALQPPCAQ